MMPSKLATDFLTQHVTTAMKNKRVKEFKEQSAKELLREKSFSLYQNYGTLSTSHNT
jgi:hypothetical protein